MSADDTIRYYLSGGPGNTDQAASLGGSRGAEITAHDMARVFDDVAASEAGKTEYRCIWVRNHDPPDMADARIYQQDAQGTVRFELAPDGPEVPLTIPDEATEPREFQLSDLSSSGGIAAVNSLAALHGDYFLRVLPDSTTIHRLNQSTRQITLGSVQEPDLGSDVRGAVYTGSRLIWIVGGTIPGAIDAPWNESNFTLGTQRSLSIDLSGVTSVNAVAFDRARNKLLIAGHLEKLYTYDYDPVAGTLTNRTEYTTDENIYGMTLIQGTNILVVIHRTEQGIVTMHYAAWNPATGALDEARPLDVALPDTAVGEDEQTAMTVVGAFLCYNIDIAGNDFRSYRISMPQLAFAAHASRADALQLGDMAAGQERAVWIKRVAEPSLETRADAGLSLVVEGDA